MVQHGKLVLMMPVGGRGKKRKGKNRERDKRIERVREIFDLLVHSPRGCNRTNLN